MKSLDVTLYTHCVYRSGKANMLLLVFMTLIFTVMIKFSDQTIEPSLRIKVELCEMKYDLILKEVLHINKNMENIWDTLNDTRVRCAKTQGIILKESSGNNGPSPPQSADTNPVDMNQKLIKIEKGFREEKHVSRKRWRDLEAKYEVCKCDNTSSSMDTKQAVTLLTKQGELRNDLSTLRVDQGTIRTDLSTLRSGQDKIRTEVMALNDRLKRETEQTRNENIKLKEEIANTKSTTDALTNQLNDIKDVCAKLKNELNLLPLKQKGWVQHDSYMYKVFYDKLSWSDAMAKCKSESNGNGFLAEIQNMNKAIVIKGLVQNESSIWLGGCDLDKNGLWEWCGSGSSITFANWYENEPNNNGIENCLQQHAGSGTFNGTWNDQRCVVKLAFICEIPLAI